MTPQERAAQFATIAAEIDTVVAQMAPLRNEIATRQVKLDTLTARYVELRRSARQLVPSSPDLPEVPT